MKYILISEHPSLAKNRGQSYEESLAEGAIYVRPGGDTDIIKSRYGPTVYKASDAELVEFIRALGGAV